MGFGKVNFESSCHQHGTINCVLYKINSTVLFFCILLSNNNFFP